MDKVAERRVLEAFLTARGMPITGIQPREKPDFLIHSSQSVLGLEVTQLCEAQPRQVLRPQQWKAEASKIIKQAQGRFEKRHPDRLVVHFEFRPEWRPDQVEAAALADELAATVERALYLNAAAIGPRLSYPRRVLTPRGV